MFRQQHEAAADLVTVYIEDKPVRVPRAFNAAAAMLVHWSGPTRTTPVSGAPRAPYCMMGVCFDCLMEIDGMPNQQGCMIPVADGMRIRRQHGAREVRP
jgi:hypothetical protein